MSGPTYIDLSGQRVTALSLTMPFCGAWVADVSLESDLIPVPPIIALRVGDLLLQGALVRQDTFAGVRTARLVAGHGGWRRKLPPLAYKDPAGIPATMILGDIAAEVGEVLVGALPIPVGQDYVRQAGPAVWTLRSLAGPGWWIDPTGITHAEPRVPSPPVATPFDIEAYDGASGRMLIATDELAQWLPGAIVANAFVLSPKLVTSVSIRSDNEGLLRIEALVDSPDVLKEAA